MIYLIWLFGSAVPLFIIKYMNTLFVSKFNRMPLIVALLLSTLLSWVSAVLFAFIALVVFLDNNTKFNDFFAELEKKFNP